MKKDNKMKKILLIFLLIPILTFSQVRHSSKQLFKDTCTFNKSVLIPNGDVGIGTVKPTSKLHTEGSFYQRRYNGQEIHTINNSIGSGLTLDCRDTVFNVHGYISLAVDGLSMDFGSISGGPHSTIFYDGNYNSGIKIRSQDGFIRDLVATLNYESFSITNNVTNDTVIKVQENGNVGIGTENPSQKIDIAGSVKIDSSLILTGIYFTDTDSSFTIPSGLSIALSWKAGGGVWDSGNIELPSNAVNGQTVSISGNWLSVSLSAPFGQTVAYTPGIAQFRHGASFVYRSSDSTWYPK